MICHVTVWPARGRTTHRAKLHGSPILLATTRHVPGTRLAWTLLFGSSLVHVAACGAQVAHPSIFTTHQRYISATTIFYPFFTNYFRFSQIFRLFFTTKTRGLLAVSFPLLKVPWFFRNIQIFDKSSDVCVILMKTNGPLALIGGKVLLLVGLLCACGFSLAPLLSRVVRPGDSAFATLRDEVQFIANVRTTAVLADLPLRFLSLSLLHVRTSLQPAHSV